MAKMDIISKLTLEDLATLEAEAATWDQSVDFVTNIAGMKGTFISPQ